MILNNWRQLLLIKQFFLSKLFPSKHLSLFKYVVGCRRTITAYFALACCVEATWSHWKSLTWSLFRRWLRNCVSRNTTKKLERKCGHCYRRACREAEQSVEQCDTCKLRDWLRNYHLEHSDAFNLFNEFLEMGEPTLLSQLFNWQTKNNQQ